MYVAPLLLARKVYGYNNGITNGKIKIGRKGNRRRRTKNRSEEKCVN